MKEETGPWVLYLYDPTGDDDRGISKECGNYRSLKNAEAQRDKWNAPLLSRKNESRQRKFRAEHDAWLDQEALIAAGRRPPSASYIEPTIKFVPLRTYTNTSGSKDEHYYVEEMEFEDD